MTLFALRRIGCLLRRRWGAGPWVAVLAVAGLLISGVASSDQVPPEAREILQKVLASDPWGLTGAEIKASVTLTDKHGSRRALSFVAASKRYDPPLSMSLVRFSAPPDLAGAGF